MQATDVAGEFAAAQLQPLQRRHGAPVLGHAAGERVEAQVQRLQWRLVVDEFLGLKA